MSGADMVDWRAIARELFRALDSAVDLGDPAEHAPEGANWFQSSAYADALRSLADEVRGEP